MSKRLQEKLGELRWAYRMEWEAWEAVHWGGQPERRGQAERLSAVADALEHEARVLLASEK